MYLVVLICARWWMEWVHGMIENINVNVLQEDMKVVFWLVREDRCIRDIDIDYFAWPQPWFLTPSWTTPTGTNGVVEAS